MSGGRGRVPVSRGGSLSGCGRGRQLETSSRLSSTLGRGRPSASRLDLSRSLSHGYSGNSIRAGDGGSSPSYVRGHHLETSPRLSTAFGRGYNNSSSRAVDVDAMTDTDGVYQRGEESEEYDGSQYMGHEDFDDELDTDTPSRPSNDGSNADHMAHYTSQRLPIRRVGKKFGNGKAHRAIRKILEQHLEGPWPRYSLVPKEVKDTMFEKYKSIYGWNRDDDYLVKEGFNNAASDLYKGIMYRAKVESRKLAKQAGKNIPPNKFNYQIMRSFPPRLWHRDLWVQLCEYFSSPDFAKSSERGSKNRNSTDSSGMTSRHTGGSIGYDEHRIRLEIKLKRPVTMCELFLETHLDKESKALFRAGHFDDSSEGMQFCTERSKEIYDAYCRKMIEKHGKNKKQHPVGDYDCWLDSTGEGRGSYGIGSSDPYFIVTGKESASSMSGLTQAALQQSQKEFQQQMRDEMQQQVDEIKENMREEVQQQMRDEIRQELREEMRQEMASMLEQLGINRANHGP